MSGEEHKRGIRLKDTCFIDGKCGLLSAESMTLSMPRTMAITMLQNSKFQFFHWEKMVNLMKSQSKSLLLAVSSNFRECDANCGIWMLVIFVILVSKSKKWIFLFRFIIYLLTKFNITQNSFDVFISLCCFSKWRSSRTSTLKTPFQRLRSTSFQPTAMHRSSLWPSSPSRGSFMNIVIAILTIISLQWGTMVGGASELM